MKQLFLVVSIILPLCSPFIYAKSILRGEAKPHRTTRLVILIISLITTASLIAQHDQVAVWLSLVSTLQAIIIFTLSLKYGMGGSSKLDLICLTGALIGMAIWKMTDNPAMGLYFAIGADFTGVLPTLFKTYRLPMTENWVFYALDAIAAGCNLLALTVWTVAAFSYPLYLLTVNAVIALLSFSRRYNVPEKIAGE